MLAKAKFYRGIEFVSVSDLPTDQQLLLQHSQNPERIKIMIEGKILTNCIQYSEYSTWVSTIFKSSVLPVRIEILEEKATVVKMGLSHG